jgi:hypothetical protein
MTRILRAVMAHYESATSTVTSQWALLAGARFGRSTGVPAPVFAALKLERRPLATPSRSSFPRDDMVCHRRCARWHITCRRSHKMALKIATSGWHDSSSPRSA